MLKANTLEDYDTAWAVVLTLSKTQFCHLNNPTNTLNVLLEIQVKLERFYHSLYTLRNNTISFITHKAYKVHIKTFQLENNVYL